MRSTLTTIAAIAPLTFLGLVPAHASAVPAHEDAGFVLAGDAGSTGSGSDHGRNNPNDYERQQGTQQRQNEQSNSQLHIQVPGLHP